MPLFLSKPKLVLVAVSLLLLSGCDQIRDEFTTSGGFVGPLADGILPASSQRQQADRYALTMMMFAPLALDTSLDAQESRSTIQRVNQLYQSMTDLYAAIGVCSPRYDHEVTTFTRGADLPASCVSRRVEGEPTANGYSFETLSYEVQSDLYFLVRGVVSNLDLDTEISDLIDLNPTALISLANSVPDAFPIVRRAAAGYRDSIVILADVVLDNCNANCSALLNQMRSTFGGASNREDSRGQLGRLLREARGTDLDSRWSLTNPQFSAIVSQVDRACERAYYQQQPSTLPGEMSNCGAAIPPAALNAAVSARDAFWAVVSEQSRPEGNGTQPAPS